MSPTNSDRAQLAKTSFGAELRQLRKQARLTQAALAQQAGYSRVYITLVENGHDVPGEEFVKLVAGAVGGGEQLERLFNEVVAAHRTERPEAASQVPITLDGNTLEVVNGSQQDMVVLQAQGPNGELVAVQLNRREALKKLGSAAAAITLTPGLAGNVLSDLASPSAGTPLEHLQTMYRTLIEADNLFGSSHALAGTREQLEIVERLYGQTYGADRRSLIHLRTQLAESMAWLYQDQADHKTAWYWTDRALEWSHVAAAPSLTGIVLARKSQLAGDAGDGSTAIDYAMAAAELAPPDTRLPAVAQACAAHGYALIGNRQASDEAFDTARDLVASTDFDPDSAWGGGWLDEAYIDIQQARGRSAMGQHIEALATFDAALPSLPEDYPRDRGVHLARSASAHSLAGDYDQAATLGQEALQVGQSVKSGRIDGELRSLLEDFESIENEAVAEFRELALSANFA